MRNDYQEFIKLHKRITKASWFKRAYYDKSLGVQYEK